MFKKICSLFVLFLVPISSFLAAEIEYEIRDIGTLQTHSSQAIAINNQGQILGLYNIDGSKEGKHFFVRDKDGNFHEIQEDISLVYENIPSQFYSIRIDWRYLTDDGRAFGTFTLPNANPVLFVWDQFKGIIKLGNLPGKEIMSINNAGQVLIKSVTENLDGKSVSRPFIWQNDNITKLNGLEGDLGIESEESYGIAMNNKGEVVGQSLKHVVYKNNIYKQNHATKWVNGEAIDLHYNVSKSSSTSATAINDLGEVFLTGSRLMKEDGTMVIIPYGISNIKTTNNNYIYDMDKNGFSGVYDKNGNTVIDNSTIANKILYDNNSIWMNVIGIVSANDNGEIIAQAKTIYGEDHAMLLVPIKKEEVLKDSTKPQDEVNDSENENNKEEEFVEDKESYHTHSLETIELMLKETIDASFEYYTANIEQKVRILFLEQYSQDSWNAKYIQEPYREVLMLEAMEGIINEIENLSKAIGCEQQFWFWDMTQKMLAAKTTVGRQKLDAFIRIKKAALIQK